MNINLMISGLSGAVVGGIIFIILSNPEYSGGSGESLGQYLLWLIALATIACLLAAAYGCIAKDKAAMK